MIKKKVLIMGAAGRDFHNFNCLYRDNEKYDVICFTATQIPDIEGRIYPASLAGKLYPKGIPIEDEDNIVEIIVKKDLDEVVFSYSDVSYEYLMRKAARVMAAGANFILTGTKATMISSSKPVIAVCAVRTGCGKSQTTRRAAEILKDLGRKVVVIRHPMPYGNLEAQRVQRFATIDDLHRHKCTIEEMEEYEPHINKSIVVYAGVDYHAILREAEQEADVLLWDGGNNDMPFYKPDLMITVVDPHRPGHEISYYPGENNLLLADIIVINKMDSAAPENVEIVRNNIRLNNPGAIVVDAASPIFIDRYDELKGKKVLVVEDGPTLTHGEMKYGAGIVAARKLGVSEIVDPRPYIVGTIAETYRKYPYIGTLLPAMGYSPQQVKDLETSINNTPAEAVIIATPIDLGRFIDIKKPSYRVTYDLQEIGKPDLSDLLIDFVRKF